MPDQNLILQELKTISKILSLAHGDALEKEISKLASTDERKKIWVLINGVKLPKDIADESGVTTKSVNRFLVAGEKSGLIENPWGKPPKRLINYVPVSWVELLETSKEKDEESLKMEELKVKNAFETEAKSKIKEETTQSKESSA